jgi:predicted RND superfamily exporter protein
MVEALMPLRDLEPRALTESDLPEGLVGMLGGGRSARRLLVLPWGNMWDMRNALSLVDELQRSEPDAEVAGSVPVQGLLYRYVMADVPWVGSLAIVLVALLAAFDLRRPVLVIGAVGTLIGGLIWAGSALEWFGVRLSVINLVGVPILLGIGVDVVIHLLHRLQEEGPGGVRRAWRTTGVAAIVSTATTVASFSALLLASSRGVQSLGLVVVIGLTTITIVSGLLLPLAWAAGWRLSGRAPADQSSAGGST